MQKWEDLYLKENNNNTTITYPSEVDIRKPLVYRGPEHIVSNQIIELINKGHLALATKTYMEFHNCSASEAKQEINKLNQQLNSYKNKNQYSLNQKIIDALINKNIIQAIAEFHKVNNCGLRESINKINELKENYQ